MKGGQAFEQRSREFFSAIGPHLKGLRHFVRHELGYLQAVGDLPPGHLTPDEVVDAVLLRAYRPSLESQAAPDIKRGRLIRLAIEYLESEVRRLRWERERGVHIEEDIPETPPTEQVSMLGDDILDFYEPDEDLKLEDVIPDIDVPTPEEETERKELRQCVGAALAGMPRTWRRALLLRHGQDLTPHEVATTLGRNEKEVEGLLDQAREHLRQRLLKAGCGVKESDR